MNAKPETLQRLRELILKSEGKTSEDEFVQGCILENKETGKRGFLLNKGYLGWNSCWPYMDNCVTFDYLEDIKEQNNILGLPITLPRVLMALGKKNWLVPYAIDSEGRMYGGSLDNKIADWDLSHDADGQQEETLQAIINILQANLGQE